eukprot:TRINITY_DN66806_c9_g3_i1.p1 TRINITY_DN66806_c9_g3~~TRINITY_DN66806_c9_g3_i1.p1  ORF type:complete len:359 (-),score=19.18 TRINITY_DN66806_c9_g3_i1:401-1429(-)
MQCCSGKKMGLFAVLGVIVAMSVSFKPLQRVPLAQAHAPEGRFYAPTSHGRTFFTLHCLEGFQANTYSGRLTVFVHGFSMASELAWGAPFVKKILQNGPNKCAVTYDLYGRGNSDVPPENFALDERAFSSQLMQLLGHLSFADCPAAGKPIDLVGVSLGGAIAVSYTALRPHLVKSLVLVAPAGLPVPIPADVKLGMLPIIKSTVTPYIFENILLKHLNRAYPDPAHPIAIQHAEAGREHLNKMLKGTDGGFMRSLLSTVEHFSGLSQGDLEEFYTFVGMVRTIKTTVIWGEEDIVVPFKLLDLVKTMMPNANIITMPGVGHDVLLEEDKAAEFIAGSLGHK